MAIEKLAGEALIMPVIDIVSCKLTQTDQTQLGQQQKYIFISQNAVEYGAGYVPTIAPGQVYAIGQATAAALNRVGVQAQIAPPPHNSEALLKMADFQQVDGQAIAIVKGEGGRDELRAELQKRGANVTEYVVYQRQTRHIAPAKVESMLRSSDVVVLTSQEIARALIRNCNARALQELKQKPLLLIHSRVKQALADISHQALITIAESASESALTRALVEFQQASGPAEYQSDSIRASLDERK